MPSDGAAPSREGGHWAGHVHLSGRGPEPLGPADRQHFTRGSADPSAAG